MREILISESAWEEMTCLFAPSLGEVLVTINLLNALVWLAINLVNRLRERLVNHRDQQ
ncbi:TPA: hypothetical protein ACF34J_003371 [Escherichia coli]|nr:hypothetical protein [Escherichia coli]MDK6336785.1 hypothetical protein [Escherichia coli]